MKMRNTYGTLSLIKLSRQEDNVKELRKQQEKKKERENDNRIQWII
jgi:hypothetical protein